VGKAFVQYFEQLFSSSGFSNMEDCLSAVTAREPPEMNEKLAAVFTPEEVDQALAQMHPLKSPGPDGFGVCFYQNHWTTIGDEVRKAVLDFLNGGIFDPLINTTFIALIPKIENATSVTEYSTGLLVCVMSYTN